MSFIVTHDTLEIICCFELELFLKSEAIADPNYKYYIAKEPLFIEKDNKIYLDINNSIELKEI